MRSVELVEPDGPDVRAGRPDHRRTYRRIAIALAVVMLGVAVVAQRRADAHADARDEHLASIDGLIAAPHLPLRARWTLAHPDASVVYGRAADGVLLGGSSVDGNVELHGVDAATGAVLWRTPVDVPVDQTLWAWCDPLRTSADVELAVCTAGPDAPAAAVALASRTLWTVVPRTGRILTTMQVRGDATVLVTSSELVVADNPSHGRWRVRSLDPSTGSPRWTFAPEVGARSDQLVQPQLIDDGDDRVLASLSNHVWLLDPKGQPLVDRATPDGTWWTALRPGSSVGRTLARRGDSSGITLLPEGRTTEVAEPAVPVHPDDGSAPGVVFTSGPRGHQALVARSSSTGEQQWRSPENALTALVLDGTLYIGTPTGLVALDASTGEVRWRRDVGQAVDEMTTDGTDLLVVSPPTTVTAYALSDGHPAWTADVADAVGASTVATIGFAPGARGIVAWDATGAATILD